tara:strand:- start:550 stop:2079 length:1530 start_codon:yes stop_codon:yes gene_type:complete
MGSGICLLDYDNDGDLDAYFPQGAPLLGWEKNIVLENKLYRNDNLKWTDVTEAAGVGDKSYSMGCACADYDNDGSTDLYVTNFGKDIFYHNNGDGTFKDITSEVGIENLEFGMSAAFFDSDNDGWLDLYVTNYIEFSIEDNPECISAMQIPSHGELYARSYCNPDNFLGVSDKFYYNNKGIFIDRSSRSGINKVSYKGLGVVPGDIDNDGDMDIYVANDTQMNLLFVNDGKGRFIEKALFMGVGFNENGLPEAGMGVDLGDFNQDGWLDIFVTNFSGETNTLYLNKRSGLFIDATNKTGLGKPSIPFLAFGTKFVDLNLDGWLDIFVANGHVIDNINLFNREYQHAQHNQIYLNQGNGTFLDKTIQINGDIMDKAVSRGAAFGDIDNDGDIDFIISNNNDSAALLFNSGSPKHNWIGFELEGILCNRDAIGSKLRISTKSGDQTSWVNPAGSYLTSNDKRVVFGIANDEIILSLEIEWAGSNKEYFSDLEPNFYYKVIQGKSLSIIDQK